MENIVNSKLGKTSNIVDNYYSNLFVVDSRQNILGDYVRKIRKDKNLSVKDVSDRSGGGISSAYVNRIENELINLSTPKQIALAKGLGVAKEIIFSLVQGADPNDPTVIEEGLARGLQNLPPGRRKLAHRQIASIIESLSDKEHDFDYGDFDDDK